MAKRITCKTHDANEVITHVGVEGEERQTMLSVWERIQNGGEEFYTYENANRASVYARERAGTKYLTTHPDGNTPNNLDELSDC